MQQVWASSGAVASLQPGGPCVSPCVLLAGDQGGDAFPLVSRLRIPSVLPIQFGQAFRGEKPRGRRGDSPTCGRNGSWGVLCLLAEQDKIGRGRIPLFFKRQGSA